MSRCEDFPCCGHDPIEGCPNPRLIEAGYLPYPCVECGEMIRREDAVRGHESFHAACLSRMSWGDDEWCDDDEYRDNGEW